MPLPLSRVEVLDLGTQTPGKYATFLLAQMGATVIRVERPARAGGLGDEDRVLNRGKRSLALDLRQEAGREALARLATRADVLIESYRPGVAGRLGAGWEQLSQRNARLVYCSLSGYGQTGPDRSRPAYDLNLVAASGLLGAIFGAPEPSSSESLTDGPSAEVPGTHFGVPGAYLADAVSGLTATLAIVLALLERERTGRGRYVDLAMLDSAFSLLTVSHGLRRVGREEPEPSPLYAIYETSDGRHVALAAIRPSSRRALFEGLGRSDLADPASAEAGETDLARVLRDAFLTATAEEWIERLRPLDVEIEPVRRSDEAFDDSRLRSRGLVEEIAGEEGRSFTVMASPLRPSWREESAPSPPAPRAGEDSDEILAELGYAAEEIAELHRDGVV